MSALGVLLLTGCSSGEKKPEPTVGGSGSSGSAGSSGSESSASSSGSSTSSTSSASSGSESADSDPAAFDFVPDPARAPRTAAAALRIARAVAAGPEQWGPGYVRRTPYESDPTRPADLGADCVWQRGALPDGFLAGLTRYSELPASGRRGPIRVNAVVTVHREVSGADWEMAGTLEDALRCPEQRLRDGERITGLISLGSGYGAQGNGYAEDSVHESGQYHSDTLGGPHSYVWSQARVGQVTVAATARGARGRTEKEIDEVIRQGLSSMVIRLRNELEAAR
ncbi:hypothetical protein [Streptomyces paludis]|uniref:hypothetical protein n=1 Tax=Streptomyces paludis TaxID=2282738 RepID=UPI0013B44790|nr:hypothetical protein [Streptomyces paludis]